MAIFKCKMCGEPLDLTQMTGGICRCSVCSTCQTVSLKINDSEKIEGLFGSANHYRRNNEFDVAMSVYQQIITENSEDSEAYWGVVLSRYGIEYVKDPKTEKMIPTINRTQLHSVFNDDDFNLALTYATEEQRELYRQEATVIDEILKGIWAISSKEEPFDVFICYKETDKDGRRTEDSVIAQQIYKDLTRDGIKTFFARVTLEDKLGSAYEPYIFSALQSSKVMVVVGTRAEHLNAVWVRNEWSRYLSLIESGEKKYIIPAYKSMNPYDLPKEFVHIQGQDLDKLGGLEDLILVVEKRVGKERSAPVADKSKELSTLIKRGYDAVSFGSFDEGVDFAKKIIDIEFENPDAYVILLLAELEIEGLDQLMSYNKPITKIVNYRKALAYAQGELKERLQKIGDSINASLEKTTTPLATPVVQETKIERPKVILDDWEHAHGTTWEIDSSGVLRFPYGTTVIEEQAFSDNGEIKEIIIPEGVTKIGKWAFELCSGLEKVTLPSTLIEIDNAAFADCTSLTSITFPGSLRRIGDNAFVDTGLEEIVIPFGVKEIGDEAFACITTLKTVRLPRGITRMGASVFLESPDLVIYREDDSVLGWNIDWNGDNSPVYVGNSTTPVNSTVQSGTTGGMSSPFFTAPGATTPRDDNVVAIVGETIKTGTEPTASFVRPPVGTEVIRGNGGAINDSAYASNSKLKYIMLESGTTKIGRSSFYNCSSLEMVFLPDSLQIIGNSAFRDCKKLKYIKIPKNVSTIDTDAFLYCKAIENIDVDPQNNHFKSVDGCLYSKDGTKLIKYASGKKDKTFIVPEGVIALGDSSLSSSPNLTEIMLPGTLETIGYSAMSSISGLKKIKLPSSLKSIEGYAFACSHLTDIYIPSSVTKIGQLAFNSSTNLTIRCGAKSKPSGYHKDWCYDNVNYKQISVKWGVAPGPDDIATTAKIPPVKTMPVETAPKKKGESAIIPADTRTIEKNKFINSIITSAEIPASVLTIDAYAFSSCANLESLTFAKDGSLRTIGGGAFKDCTSLTEVFIPRGVKKIDYSAFEGCTSLEVIYIPDSVTFVGRDAFKGCSADLLIYFEGKKPLFSSIPKGWDKLFNSDKRPLIWGTYYSN
ncbi:MAG: leucine-rich repeat protein [Clostridia bacterium]|nr:leucine-rich repeat protein [Clostridia bacterium]